MAEAIIFGYDPGATLYVRFVTSRTTSVFAALTEGTGSGASFYFVTEAALVTAGLNAAGTWSGKIFVGTPSGSANDVNIGTVTLPWTGSAVGGGGPYVETRDLKPPQFVWELPRRANDKLYSPQVLTMAPGESVVAGFDCANGIILTDGVMVQSFTDPAGLSGELSATKKGTNGRWCNCTITASDDAVVGTEQWVTVLVTNSNGDGPIKVAGLVRIVAAHP